MKRIWMMVLTAAVLFALPAAALAGDDVPGSETVAAAGNEGGLGDTNVLSMLGACLGAGVIVIGGGLSISRISSKALESIARQPEAAGQMFLSWLIPAAMIEGAMLFGVTICLLVLYS
jgi:F-type H+-transporting ATPase subunit c